MARAYPPNTGPMPSSFDDDEFANEPILHKVFRKLKEEPLVPLGIGLTVYAFVSASRAVRRGDSKQANRMFRARVAAQGFTVLAMVAGGMYYSQDRERTKELRRIKQETEAEEKRQMWLRELEARDEENKAMRAALLGTPTTPPSRQQPSAAAGVSSSQQDETGNSAQQTSPSSSSSILARVGRWDHAETTTAAASETEDKGDEEGKQAKAAGAVSATNASPDTPSEKNKRRENPRSSLADLGEVYGKKKEDDLKK